MKTSRRTWSVPDKRFGVELSFRDETAVLETHGEIDVYTFPTLSQAIDDVLAMGYKDLVIDLYDVVFLDSGGISVLIRAHKLLKERSGTLKIDRVHGHAYRVLEVTGLLDFLNVHPCNRNIAA